MNEPTFELKASMPLSVNCLLEWARELEDLGLPFQEILDKAYEFRDYQSKIREKELKDENALLS